MNIPSFRLAFALGKPRWLLGCYGPWNWRVTFGFDNGHAVDVGLYGLSLERTKLMAMRNPPHPGGIVRRQCLDTFDLSVTEAAKGLGVTRQALSDLVNGKAGISVEMAIRLSKAFGSSPETWLSLQMAYDLWQARERLRSLKVRHFKVA
jgi:addiction module HigA family antidote